MLRLLGGDAVGKEASLTLCSVLQENFPFRHVYGSRSDAGRALRFSHVGYGLNNQQVPLGLQHHVRARARRCHSHQRA